MRSRTWFAGLAGCILLAGCNATTQTAQSSLTPQESRMMQLAAEVEARGDYDTAAALYARAAQSNGESPEVQLKLGEAYLKSGNYNAAGDAFARVLQSSPQHPDALLGLGTAQLKRGDHENGARTLAQAAALVNAPSAYNRLGTAQIMLGRFDDALASFEQARTLAPNDLDNTANVALAQALAGRGDAAVASMDAVVRSPLARPRHRANYVLILAIAGRPNDAAAVTTPDLSAADKKALLARGKKVRDTADPAAKARAVGLASAA